MARTQNNFHTIYHVMDARGVFDSNPANVGAVSKDGENLYKGPVKYPRMFYHPEGETRITNPGEVLTGPYGPQRVGEQSELIWRMVESEEEEEAARAEGWHDHPAKAIRASGKAMPPMSAANKIESLEEENERLKKLLAGLESGNGLEAPRGRPPGSDKALLG